MRRLCYLCTLSVISLACCVLIGFLAANPSGASSTAHAMGGDSLESDDLHGTLLRLGYGPRALTVAGVSSSETEQMVNAVAAVLSSETNWPDLNYHIAQATDYSAEVADLRRTMRAGAATLDHHDQLDHAAAQLTAHRAAAEKILDDCRNAAADVLSNEQYLTLKNIDANRGHEVPIEFTVVARPEDHWPKLRDALTHVEQCETHDLEPCPDHHAFLEECESNPAVSDARAALDANIETVTFVWNQAIESIDG